MLVYDISTDIASVKPYPGDPDTEIVRYGHIGDGGFNLTSVTMSLHTGTHIDAPLHTVDGGVSAGEIDLSVMMGDCAVLACNGFRDDLTGEDIEEIMKEGCTRVILKTLGACRLTRSAAFALISAGVELVGIDAPSVACADEEQAVHRELALAGVTVLEGLHLRHVQSDMYTLLALPLKISGTEAAPVRAVLLKD